MIKLCKCGCGMEVSLGKTFISGHNFNIPSNQKHYARIRNGVRSRETRLKMSISHTGVSRMLFTPEQRQNIGRSVELSYSRNPNLRGMRSASAKLMWQDPEKARRLITSSHARPTSLEYRLIDIIETYSLPLAYNGNNGKVIIGGKCPDFVGIQSPCIVELFGDYWHGPDFPERLTEFELVSLYEERGYKCLVLWGSEVYEMTDDVLAFLLLGLCTDQVAHIG